MADEMGDPPYLENVYKVSRRIKKTEHTVYNALRSIYEDSLFVQEIRNLWKDLPLVANLRCGLWYAPEFDGTCYFKSTDGHNGNWSFSVTRLNLHIATLAAERGGCCIVDATRKGKRFPDSMSKTIPIWTCVLNRVLADFRPPRTQETIPSLSSDNAEQMHPSTSQQNFGSETLRRGWDCSLHLPLWVSQVEKANIESQIDGWVKSLKSAGADLASLGRSLKKPLRPLWISQKTIIWLNEVPHLDNWDFTPVILVSASRPSLFTERFTDAEFGWRYIPGAADDEESWARGLTPALYWKHSLDILSSGPSSCIAKVSDIVEQDRVYRAVRGNYAPQVRVKKGAQSLVESKGARTPSWKVEECMETGTNGKLEYPRPQSELGSVQVTGREAPEHLLGFHWIGNTGLAVGNADCGNRDTIYEVVDCIINCGAARRGTTSSPTGSYLYLPIVGAKFDRHSLQENLGEAVSYARTKLMCGSTVLIYCSNGEDISVSVCLAILLSCFFPASSGNSRDQQDKKLTSTTEVIKKSDVRERLIYLSSFNSNARPSRGSLRQVYNFFNSTGDREDD